MTDEAASQESTVPASRRVDGLRADVGRLLISCPDRPGIVAAVSQFLYEQNANIIDSQQHSTEQGAGVFFMRVEFHLPDVQQRQESMERAFTPIAESFEMDWRLTCEGRAKRMAIFVSRLDHALLELLWRRQAGDLRADVALVISNHPYLASTVEAQGIPFFHVPVERGRKDEAEARQLALLEDHDVDLVVLARYMQILSPRFVGRYPGRIINIHHSFLPAFVGANPYRAAYERGVKLIGATAHYVTDQLDAGPIIEQSVQRVDHRHGPEEMQRLGRYVERLVLAQAITWDVEDRVVLHGNRTIVFP
jgi:formyltetrahydrofolate deformylase